MFDLYHELLTNQKFVDKLEGLSQKIVDLEYELGEAAQYSDQLREVIFDIVRHCDYNVGFVLPYFFPESLKPKADSTDKSPRPLSLLNRPYAFCLTALECNSETTIRGSRQIVKSSSLIARQLVLTHIFSGYRSMYIAPHLDNMKTYANRMRDMERTFRYSMETSGYRNNLAFKEFPNHSTVELVRVDQSAQDARSRSATELLFDEFQHFDVNFLPEVEMVLRDSELKAKLFTGTSTTIDSPLETKFQQGSQGYWHVRCPHCAHHWINCGEVKEVLPIIQPDGPTCPITKKLLNMENGEYVHAYESRLEAGFISYHIPQILIPDFVTDPTQWIPFYKALQDYTQAGLLHTFLEEALAIPSVEGNREISLEDLKRMCCLPDTPESLKAKAQRGYYKCVVSGIDWGGSDWNKADKTKLSFTFHVIIGVTTENQLEIIHMQKYAGMAWSDILHFIALNHVAYKGSHIASDFSAGSIYNLLLRDQPGIRATTHFVLGYTGNPRAAIFGRPEKSELPNHFSINRTETITNTFMLIKRDVPRLKCFAWPLAESYLKDILNLFRIPGDAIEGRGLKYRRHGSKADDGLHAINFAHTLIKVILNEPMAIDRNLRAELEQQLRGGGLTPRYGPMGGSNNYVVSG